jgi:rSAM/selenodomain-associated transferase 2
MKSISIVIPALNEEDALKRLLPYLTETAPGCEIITSDGGSGDKSVCIASAYGKVVQGSRGRGAQMNAGARDAGGEILWFVHADCLPHPHAVKKIRTALESPGVVGGGFTYCLDVKGFRYRVAESLSNWKNRIFSLLYGDMGIFVRSIVFKKMGGYRDIPLMEDMDFSRRLKKQGEVVILPYTVRTSARRWLDDGYGKYVLRTWTLQAAWRVGVKPRFLARWYRF